MGYARALGFAVLAVLLAGCGQESRGSDPVTDSGAQADGTVTPDAAVDAEVIEDAAPPPDAAPPTLPPLPAVQGLTAAEDLDPDPAVVRVRLTASMARHTLAEGLEVEGYGYEGVCPGPLIQARVGDTVIVEFQNDLPEPTTVHWHGLRIDYLMDGSPRVQEPVQPGETFTYTFVPPDAGTYWYHPHVRTNEQMERGLYGVLVVHEAEPPQFDAERALVLDDILLDGDRIAPFLVSHPEVMHGRSGNVLLTNGVVDPTPGAAEEGQTERWRIVNTANARTMSLSLRGASWRVIGTDGGLIHEPYTTDRIQIAVGQRYELEVQYDQPGTVELVSHVLVVDNGAVVERPFVVQQIEVAGTGVAPEAVALPEVPSPRRGRQDETIALRFDAVAGGPAGIIWRINEQANAREPLFTATEGDYYRIILDNRAGPEHPFHLHGQFFEILPDGREETEQPGLKDTVLVPGQSRVTIFAHLDNPGQWMAHCHILEHAELGMMAEFMVDPAE